MSNSEVRLKKYLEYFMVSMLTDEEMENLEMLPELIHNSDTIAVAPTSEEIGKLLLDNPKLMERPRNNLLLIRVTPGKPICLTKVKKNGMPLIATLFRVVGKSKAGKWLKRNEATG